MSGKLKGCKQSSLIKFSSCLEQLDSACQLEQYDNLTRLGLVKTFEWSFELALRALTDLLNYEGFVTRGPRWAIRTAFHLGYINENDCELMLEALEQRKQLAHTYRIASALETQELIREQYAPLLMRLNRALIAHNIQ